MTNSQNQDTNISVDDIALWGAKILVQPDAKAISKDGIEIADTAGQKIVTGTVIRLGTGVRDRDGNDIPFEVSVGDRVLYEWLKGTELDINGDDYLVLSSENIEGILS